MSRFTNMLMLAVLTLLGLAAARTGERLALVNYGVVLEERGDVDLVREEWVHTYSVRFPLDTVLTPAPEDACVFSNPQLCLQHPSVSRHLGRVKTAMVREWASLVGVYQSLPLTNFSMEDPSTPQGQITNAIYTNIQDQRQEDKMNFVESKKYRSSSTRLSSIEVVDQVNYLRDNLTNFRDLVVGVEKNLVHNVLDSIPDALAQASDWVWQVHVAAQRIRDALTAAKGNMLTLDLMLPTPMEMTLINIERLMETKYHPFVVTRLGTTTSFYFNTDVPVYLHHEGDMLYISVVVPLTYGPRYTAYRVQPFPLLYGDSAYGTLLSGVPDYFLLSTDGKRYTTMTEDQFDQCHEYQVGVTTCPESHTSVSASLVPHCVLGLMTENKTMVKAECQFGLLAEPLAPTVWEYSPGLVLLTQAEEALVKCDDVTLRVLAAPVQVVQLPCRCSLTASNMEVKDRLTGCANVSKPQTLYPFNLGALLQVHSPKSLQNFNGTTLVPSAPTVDLPTLALTPPARQDLHDIHPGMALNLTSVMLKWSAGEKVFTSPVDALLDAERERLEAGPRVTVTALAVLGGIILVVCLFAFFVIYKNHKNLGFRMHLLEHHHCFDDADQGESMMPMQVVSNTGPTATAYAQNGDAAERANLTNGGNRQ